jgi:uncharacterized membrane protein (UPF0182 family)
MRDSPAESLPTWRIFLIELLIYAVLLGAYFALVLHYLGGWFKDLFDHNRNLFAVMALLVMIGQAVGLEIVSTFVLWLLRVKKK